MKMNTSKEWLRKKAEQEDGCYVSVGGLVQALEQTGQGTSNGLSLEEFAEKVDVDLVELLKIETEEHHKPAIRTVHKIAAFLKVPEQKRMALAGLLQVKDVQFQNAALKFATRSAPVEKLSGEEHSDLEEIVKFLCER